MAETEFVIEPDRQDIIITRVFDAPPDVVFEAFTDPEVIPSWMGPRKTEVVIDRWDLEAGGLWRYVSRDTDGTEYGFRGVFHDVQAPGRIVQTFEFEGMPGHVQLETATFEDLGGRTKYVGVSVFQSVEDRDAMARSGMQKGVLDSMDRLAEIVETG